MCGEQIALKHLAACDVPVNNVVTLAICIQIIYEFNMLMMAVFVAMCGCYFLFGLLLLALFSVKHLWEIVQHHQHQHFDCKFPLLFFISLSFCRSHNFPTLRAINFFLAFSFSASRFSFCINVDEGWPKCLLHWAILSLSRLAMCTWIWRVAVSRTEIGSGWVEDFSRSASESRRWRLN